jgi:NADPH:quinone reductase-like Zn-dependent oxidoreductase
MTMRVISQTRFGGPEVLELLESDKPSLVPTEVLVRVAAASINPVETSIRAGRLPVLGQPPFRLGWDIAGVVEEVMPGMHRFKPGDAVFGMPMMPRELGGYGEYIAAPSRQIVAKPASLSFEEAAALPMAGLTAWQALVDTAGLTNGQRVLIHAAGGGVGHLAVQIAKALGAYVIGTASPSKADFVKSLGADEVIDYTQADFAEVAKDIDIVLELVGQDYAERSFKTLRPGGILVSGVGRSNPGLWQLAEQAGVRFAGIIVEPDQVGLDALVALVTQGRLQVHVERVFPLAKTADAHRLLETGHVLGKIVLKP